MNFTAFNLKKEVIEALNNLGYFEATKVQEIVIPKALKNENIIVKSATGTGKTHSFLIPIINNLEFNKNLQAIIISPTRELAHQTYNFTIQFKKYFPNLEAKLFTSGIDTSRSKKKMENGCEIIIATPGRLKYLIETLQIDFSSLKTIVLDEADMLIDKTFLDEIDSIISKINTPQIEVFSATISKQVEVFLRKYISPDYVLSLSENNQTSETVSHYFVNTKHRNINDLIVDFIKVKNPYLLMIFANSNVKVKEIYNYLSSIGYKCGIISGDLQPRERKAMLKRINNNEFQYIICSDIASRGLDLLDVTDVLSVELPTNLEYYYHRAGRTGRIFKDGNSYVFYDLDHTDLVLKLIENGLKPKFLKYNNGDFIEDKPILKQERKSQKVNTKLDTDIKKAIARTKSDKVKPGYKKKVKKEIERVKTRHYRLNGKQRSN